MWSVLNYCFEGNTGVGFVVQDNKVRQWFHVPWLHLGPNPREFVHGLTRERSSRPFELSPLQTELYRNYAVGFYNDRGGREIGRVWRDPLNPDVTNVNFPEGTVAFKLLFTTAPTSVVPYLGGSPEWAADIDRAQTTQEILNTVVRLLQIDIAVKDQRADKAEWVFGTFHYDSAVSNTDSWLRLRPLALMWGDDPKLTPSGYQSGDRPQESWVNPVSPLVIYRQNPPQGAQPPATLGWAGRANGPVDNPRSSCLSCHSTAQNPAQSPMTPPPTSSEAASLRWFRNLAVNEAFDQGSQTLDFSLQLGVGIQNLQDFQAFVRNMGGVIPHRFPGSVRTTLTPSDSKEFQFTRDPE